MRLSEEGTCKVCGFKSWILEELIDHLRSHDEFNKEMDKVLPGFSEKSDLR